MASGRRAGREGKCEESRFRLKDRDERTALAKYSNEIGRRTFPNTYIIPLLIHNQ